MRSGGRMATAPRPAKVDPCVGGRGREAKRRKRLAAPQHSTFRRVAVFVPLNPYCEPRDVRTLT